MIENFGELADHLAREYTKHSEMTPAQLLRSLASALFAYYAFHGRTRETVDGIELLMDTYLGFKLAADRARKLVPLERQFDAKEVMLKDMSSDPELASMAETVIEALEDCDSSEVAEAMVFHAPGGSMIN